MRCKVNQTVLTSVNCCLSVLVMTARSFQLNMFIVVANATGSKSSDGIVLNTFGYTDLLLSTTDVLA